MTAEFVSETIFAKIKRHWNGQGALAWAYWGFGVVGGIMLLFLLGLSFLFILPFAYSPNRSILQSPTFMAYLFGVGLLYIGYIGATAVMVWRCGDNVRWPGWKYLSRASVLVWIGNWVITLIMFSL